MEMPKKLEDSYVQRSRRRLKQNLQLFLPLNELQFLGHDKIPSSYGRRNFPTRFRDDQPVKGLAL